MGVTLLRQISSFVVVFVRRWYVGAQEGLHRVQSRGRMIENNNKEKATRVGSCNQGTGKKNLPTIHKSAEQSVSTDETP